MDLSSAEIRVLGCLLEKQRTTPDHYPLSLNSLRLACNQSTNRDPVVQYDEAVIRDALHRLGRRGYVRLAGAARAAKYRHLLAEALPMSSAEQAAMCVLMLRGAQTPGELKQRCERMHPFADLAEVLETLAQLIERRLVARLERRPGQKEERYEQLLGEDEAANGGLDNGPAPATYAAPPIASAPAPLVASAQAPLVANAPALLGADGEGGADRETSAREHDLLARVERLEREVAELRGVIGD